MIADGRSSGPGAVASPLAQTAAGLTAHALASGCLPGPRALALLLPAAVAAVVVTDRALATRPLLRLAAGQLAVHAVLALAVCAGVAHAAAHAGAHAGAHAHATEPPHLVVTAAHVAALVVCRAGLDRLLVRLGAAVLASATALVRPLPVPAVRVTVRAPVPPAGAAVPPQQPLVAVAPRRGPPALRPLLPA